MTRFYDSDKKMCHYCGANCMNCDDESGKCNQCFPGNVDGHYILKESDPTICVLEMYVDPVPECTDDEYYQESSNTCISCGENCQECADETGACLQCLPMIDTGFFMVDW